MVKLYWKPVKYKIKGDYVKNLLKIIEEYEHKLNLEQEFERLKENDRTPPFSYELDCLSLLLSKNYITFEELIKIENDYSKNNKYLNLYALSPRTFGESWGENHILSLFSEFKKESIENNPNFDGEYDLIINNIKVEVKACRANANRGDNSLTSRAYSHEEARKEKFKYHFQQLKPSCCDVFIWIGVCKDELLYWILTSDELKKTHKLNPQHRNENTGKGAEIFEGQVFMTEEDLEIFKTEEKNILKTVLCKGKK